VVLWYVCRPPIHVKGVIPVTGGSGVPALFYEHGVTITVDSKKKGSP
jgi:hypothetical protein